MKNDLRLPSFRFGQFIQGPDYKTVRKNGRDDYLFLYTLDGNGWIELGSDLLETRKGDLLLYLPHTPQAYGTARNSGTWELVWAHFRPRAHWLPLLEWPEWRPGIPRLAMPDGDVRKNMEAAFHQMVASARQPWSNSLAFALNHLEAGLLWADLVAREDHSIKMDPRIRRTVEFLVENPATPFSLDALAAMAGLSSGRFGHLFKQQTGQSPRQFSEAIRMERARFLLKESNLSIAEIANQCGYEDPLYFSRRFQNRTERSPRDFRMECDDQPPSTVT